MPRAKLEEGKDVPDHCHVARYCAHYRVRSAGSGTRPIIKRTAFHRGRRDTADISLSVMEWFDSCNDEEVIYQVCKHRGNLNVENGGYYVVLNVAIMKRTVSDSTGCQHRLVFTKSPGNPAHATFFTQNLMVSTALAALANSENQSRLYPVPDPIPDRAP